jgi:uncharacterized metal-binding protein
VRSKAKVDIRKRRIELYLNILDITPCLRTSIWAFLPFALFYLWLPFHVRSLFRSQSRNIPVSTLSIAKVVSLIVLIAVAVMDLFFWLLDKDGVRLDPIEP